MFRSHRPIDFRTRRSALPTTFGVLLICFIAGMNLSAQPDSSSEDRAENGDQAEALRDHTDRTGGRSSGTMYRNDAGELFVNAEQHFALTARDDRSGVATIYYSINGEAFRKYHGPFRLEQSGLNRILFYSVDISGNKEQLRVYNVYLDQRAPEAGFEFSEETNFEQGQYYMRPGATVHAVAVDDISGLLEIQLDAGQGLQSNQTDFTAEKEGVFHLRAVALDQVLNRSEPVTAKVVVDATPPQARVISQTRLYNGRTFCPLSGRVVIQANDTLSGVRWIQYRLSETGQWRTYGNAIIITNDKDEFRMRYRAVDRSGNISAEQEFACLVDRNRPVTEIQVDSAP